MLDKHRTVSFLPEVVVEFSFGPYDSLERTESFQVGFPYIGDDAVIRFGNPYQCIDFSGVVGTHFHYGNLVFGSQLKKGQRHTDVVVEISLCI